MGRIIKTLIISLQSRDIIFELAASNADEQIAAHEFFHVLGLFHTHKDKGENSNIIFPNKKYVFAPNYTTNLMSYSINKKINENEIIIYPPCYSTWCWQWAIVNPAIKIEIENEKRR